MTKQEAIETIKLALSQVEWDYPLDYAAAFDMAISAMDKQDVPDTNVGNMINRRDAIDAIDKALSRTFTEPCGEMILKDVPSAQQEPEHTMEEFMYGQDLGSPEDGSL